jgi:hypothetical protein
MQKKRNKTMIDSGVDTELHITGPDSGSDPKVRWIKKINTVVNFLLAVPMYVNIDTLNTF